MKSQLKFSLILFCSLTYCILGQGISNELDSIHHLTGSDYEKIHLYNKVLNNWENKKKYTQFGYDAHQLGKWIHKEKRWEEAIKIAQRAYLAREKAIPLNKELLKRSYYNYAIYNYRYKNYSKSIEYFEKLLKVDDSIFLRGRAYEVIGDCYKVLGDFYRSVEYQKKALENHVKKDIDKGYLVIGNMNLAVTYGKMRSIESSKLAVKHLKKAEKLFHEQNFLPEIHLYTIKNNLGNFYCEGFETSYTDKCLSIYQEALVILTKLDYPQKLSKTHYNLGLTYIEIDSTKATYHLNEAQKYIKYDPSLIPRIDFGKGLKELHYKNYHKAQLYFSKSLANYFNKGEIDIYWLPQKEDLKKITDPSKFLELLNRKLKTWIALAEKENNTEYYKEAIKTAYTCDELINLRLEKDYSDKTKLLWRSLASQINLIVLEACLKIDKQDDAFYFMEKSKALLLIQDLAKNNDNIPLSIFDKNLELKRKIASLKTQIRLTNQKKSDSLEKLVLSTEADLKNYQDSLAPIYPKYFSNYSIPKTITLSSIQQNADEAILEYTMGIRVAGAKSEAYGILITKDYKELFKIENVDELKKSIYRLRDLLDKPFRNEEDIITYTNLAYTIYTALFPKHIQNKIKDKKTTIVPDNILHYLPFEALITDKKNKTYLLEKAQIHYTHSISFDKKNSKINRNSELDFLGIAPINFNNNLNKLPKSKEELSFANQYYKGDVLLQDDATKKNFEKKANKYKILHLATHANASDSLNPWIAFKTKKLTELEIGVIKNQADLVLLSACSSSLGEVRQGEGVLSLARGFFKSGAKSVIPSLWSTNDKATATITSDFYKNLSEGQTKSAALRTAKLNYLKSNKDAEASPHYWASLVLIGDSGTLLPQANNLWMFLLGFGIAVVILLCLFLYRRKKYQASIK
ncbi:CHAT domain-containing tetratricopeptide repeat protein [uncultured Aquimarina sp.]|uniref:CHAT domain-containing protein n=1 Tax=uncultured Aquimarina sp. TaxID=575652 RepID=UPI002611C6F9|nr:CHAT domain-containing tetratricopeptide repeat protein [uncultured Aquimarina sp.]